MYSLSELVIYPVKSTRGVTLTSSQVVDSGLWGDRRYTIINHVGEIITGRTHPQITLITAKQLDDSRWQFSHPTMNTDLLLDKDSFSDVYTDIVVWEDAIEAQFTTESANLWFSKIAGEEVKLVHFGDASRRFTHRKPDIPVGFADGYPFLLATESSLSELNRTGFQNNKMAQFRPNLVIRGSHAFEEDKWKQIRIGSVLFENIKPCVRCIFTTLNPQTAERIPKGEPMKTLGKFRLLEGKGITFGINLIALNKGTIHVGDDVEILEYQEAYSYFDRR